MGSFSLGHWMIVLIVVLLLFGRGRVSESMGEFGKGIRSFRKGLTDDGDEGVSVSAEDVEPKSLVGAESDRAPIRYD